MNLNETIENYYALLEAIKHSGKTEKEKDRDFDLVLESIREYSDYVGSEVNRNLRNKVSSILDGGEEKQGTSVEPDERLLRVMKATEQMNDLCDRYKTPRFYAGDVKDWKTVRDFCGQVCRGFAMRNER